MMGSGSAPGPHGVIEFHDTPNKSDHDAFQAWRSAHPDGFFLTFKTKVKANLHVSTCHHPGSADWSREETGHSLTTMRKACSTRARELRSWADAQGVQLHACLDCLAGDEAGIDAAPAHVLSAEVQERSTQAMEGMAREARYLVRARSGTLRKVALRLAEGICAVCGTDFSKVLDGLGSRVLQVHHKRQLSLSDEPQLNGVDDLAVVCANCHCLLHVDPERAMSVEELRGIVEARR